MDGEDYGPEGYVITPPMHWSQARGGGTRGGLGETEIGIQRINNLLDYCVEEPITVLNKPSLYISEDCANLIYACHEFTGEGTDKCSLKDPIDVLRYLVGSVDIYLDSGDLECFGGGSY